MKHNTQSPVLSSQNGFLPSKQHTAIICICLTELQANTDVRKHYHQKCSCLAMVHIQMCINVSFFSFWWSAGVGPDTAFAVHVCATQMFPILHSILQNSVISPLYIQTRTLQRKSVQKYIKVRKKNHYCNTKYWAKLGKKNLHTGIKQVTLHPNSDPGQAMADDNTKCVLVSENVFRVLKKRVTEWDLVF